MRPRRKRKLTNYGDGHLHWIEESQLHRALMKSLREQTAGQNETEQAKEKVEKLTPSKMPRLTVSLGVMRERASVEGVSDSKKTSKLQRNTGKFHNQEGRNLRSRRGKNVDFEGPSQSHATMMQPRNSDSGPKDSRNTQTVKTVDFDSEATSKTESTSPHSLKTRAQRKFASNSPGGSVRRSSRFEAKLKRDLSKGDGKGHDIKASPISDKPLPKTKDFLNFLCFRNTPLHFEMKTGN